MLHQMQLDRLILDEVQVVIKPPQYIRESHSKSYEEGERLKLAAVKAVAGILLIRLAAPNIIG